MEQQDELFQLIKALGKSEKKFFKQYVNIYEKGANPIYLKLFDYLNEEETYDEEKLFKKFRDQQFKKTYPVTKHYLKNLIIKTLRHSELTVREDKDLTVYVLDIKRLMAKGLFPMAKKMIEKLKAEAYEDEKFNDIIQLLAMQRGLISMGYYKYEPEVNLDKLDEEEEQLLEKMKQLRQVMTAAIKQYSLMHYEQQTKPEEVQDEIEQLSKKKYLQDFDTLGSAKAKHTYLQFWAQYYSSKGDRKQYLYYARKKLDFVTTEKLPPSVAVNWQVLAHNHCMSAEILEDDYSKFGERVHFLEKLELQSPFHDAERFQTLSIYSLLYYIKYFDAAKLEYYVQYSLEGIKRLSPFLRKTFIYSLRTHIAYAYLKLKMLDDCWKELSELMTLTNGESRKDVVGHVKIINLMLRFEMKEYNYVSYLLKNTYRFFMYYLYTTPVHKFMIGYLKEALKTTDPKELAELNKNYLLILKRLEYPQHESDVFLTMVVEDYLAPRLAN